MSAKPGAFAHALAAQGAGESVMAKPPEERVDYAHAQMVGRVRDVVTAYFPEATSPTDPPTQALVDECLRIYTLSWVDHNVPKGPYAFKDWRSRRQSRVVAADDAAVAHFGETSGNVEVFWYPGDLYIQVVRPAVAGIAGTTPARPLYHLILGNQTVMDEDLSNLEGDLYVHYRRSFDGE